MNKKTLITLTLILAAATFETALGAQPQDSQGLPSITLTEHQVILLNEAEAKGVDAVVLPLTPEQEEIMEAVWPEFHGGIITVLTNSLDRSQGILRWVQDQ